MKRFVDNGFIELILVPLLLMILSAIFSALAYLQLALNWADSLLNGAFSDYLVVVAIIVMGFAVAITQLSTAKRAIHQGLVYLLPYFLVSTIWIGISMPQNLSVMVLRSSAIPLEWAERVTKLQGILGPAQIAQRSSQNLVVQLREEANLLRAEVKRQSSPELGGCKQICNDLISLEANIQANIRRSLAGISPVDPVNKSIKALGKLQELIEGQDGDSDVFQKQLPRELKKLKKAIADLSQAGFSSNMWAETLTKIQVIASRLEASDSIYASSVAQAARLSAIEVITQLAGRIVELETASNSSVQAIARLNEPEMHELLSPVRPTLTLGLKHWGSYPSYAALALLLDLLAIVMALTQVFAQRDLNNKALAQQ